ncbi:hypothetical protein MUG78_17525 [Gordonia alkaliphila]|uniref:hypothetical protein n=1 Tax=Gordonia alkaliphila TaxID=1053547 RepID=UPI001FF4FA34|nr:hypothetical protein [Gordonia alkaliphila]MCK0441202.1 hypothetical protein [Gordonia alkaliphila]
MSNNTNRNPGTLDSEINTPCRGHKTGSFVEVEARRRMRDVGIDGGSQEFVARLMQLQNVNDENREAAEQCAIAGLGCFMREEGIAELHVDYEKSNVVDVQYSDGRIGGPESDEDTDFEVADMLVGWVPHALFAWREGFMPRLGKEYYVTLESLEQENPGVLKE